MRPLALMTVLALAGGPVLAANGDVNLLLGRNSLAEDRLNEAGVKSATAFGVLVDLDFRWPVVLALDLLRWSW